MPSSEELSQLAQLGKALEIETLKTKAQLEAEIAILDTWHALDISASKLGAYRYLGFDNGGNPLQDIEDEFFGCDIAGDYLDIIKKHLLSLTNINGLELVKEKIIVEIQAVLMKKQNDKTDSGDMGADLVTLRRELDEVFAQSQSQSDIATLISLNNRFNASVNEVERFRAENVRFKLEQKTDTNTILYNIELKKELLSKCTQTLAQIKEPISQARKEYLASGTSTITASLTAALIKRREGVNPEDAAHAKSILPVKSSAPRAKIASERISSFDALFGKVARTEPLTEVSKAVASEPEDKIVLAKIPQAIEQPMITEVKELTPQFAKATSFAQQKIIPAMQTGQDVKKTKSPLGLEHDRLSSRNIFKPVAALGSMLAICVGTVSAYGSLFAKEVKEYTCHAMDYVCDATQGDEHLNVSTSFLDKMQKWISPSTFKNVGKNVISPQNMEFVHDNASYFGAATAAAAIGVVGLGLYKYFSNPEKAQQNAQPTKAQALIVQVTSVVPTDARPITKVCAA